MDPAWGMSGRERGFAWQVWGIVCGRKARFCVARAVEFCQLVSRCASFCVAGVRNRARQVRLLDFVTLCDNSAEYMRLHALGGVKSWQAREIWWFVGVYARRSFRRTRWEAAKSSPSSAHSSSM